MDDEGMDDDMPPPPPNDESDETTPAEMGESWADLGSEIAVKTVAKGITPGQFAAWYQGDDLIGSAAIMH